MKKIYLILGYVILFYIGFYFLKEAGILDFNNNLRSASISKFVIMIIFPIALAKWMIKLILIIISRKR